MAGDVLQWFSRDSTRAQCANSRCICGRKSPVERHLGSEFSASKVEHVPHEQLGVHV
jgi:hypothetical protein